MQLPYFGRFTKIYYMHFFEDNVYEIMDVSSQTMRKQGTEDSIQDLFCRRIIAQ